MILKVANAIESINVEIKPIGFIGSVVNINAPFIQQGSGAVPTGFAIHITFKYEFPIKPEHPCLPFVYYNALTITKTPAALWLLAKSYWRSLWKRNGADLATSMKSMSAGRFASDALWMKKM
jgi:hypothetical protein